MQSNNNNNLTPATVVDVASALVSPYFSSNDPHHFNTCDEINDPYNNEGDVAVAVAVKSSKKVAPPVILPELLSNLTPADIKLVIMESAFDDQGMEYQTARSLYGYSLENLSTPQLRKVCSMLGVGGYKSASKPKSCKLIALEAAKEKSYVSFGKINATSLLKHNTILRIINALFHKDNFAEFEAMNQKKTRQELDKGGAGNNNLFLTGLSDYINDEINNDRIGSLIMFEGDVNASKRMMITWKLGRKHHWLSYHSAIILRRCLLS
jgi:hypothetical protein